MQNGKYISFIVIDACTYIYVHKHKRFITYATIHPRTPHPTMIAVSEGRSDSSALLDSRVVDGTASTIGALGSTVPTGSNE